MDMFFRPHACGEDDSYAVKKTKARFSDPTRVGKISCLLRLLSVVQFQTPRVWGRFMTVLVCIVAAVSDPTRVGKIKKSSSPPAATFFRPHACGEDRATRCTMPKTTFSDPTRVGKIAPDDDAE